MWINLVPNRFLGEQRHVTGPRNQTVYDDDMSALLESRDLVLQDLNTEVVRPIVEALLEQIRICHAGLRRKETIRHESDTTSEGRRNARVCTLDHLRLILHHELQIGVGLSQYDAVSAS
jgi:hypothetical protein